MPPLPDVFIVPSATVADALGPDWSRYMFWIMAADRTKYLERWISSPSGSMANPPLQLTIPPQGHRVRRCQEGIGQTQGNLGACDAAHALVKAAEECKSQAVP